MAIPHYCRLLGRWTVSTGLGVRELEPAAAYAGSYTAAKAIGKWTEGGMFKLTSAAASAVALGFKEVAQRIPMAIRK